MFTGNEVIYGVYGDAKRNKNKVSRLLIQLINGDLDSGDKKKESFGRCSLRVVDIVLATSVAGLVSRDSYRLVGSTEVTS
jgi:hypothetical protein